MRVSSHIRSRQWHSPTDGGQTKAYAYEYDERQQLKKADYGSVTASGSEAVFSPSPDYQVSISGYDENGNIEALVRNGENGKVLHNLTYYYTPNKNTLDSVYNDGRFFGKYEYDPIGRLVHKWEDSSEFYVDYNVTGLVTGVYRDAAHVQPVLTNAYDDRGFRLSKTSYDTGTYQPAFKTWYVRDASGSEMSVYVQNMQSGGAPILYEVPVWGADRVGIYRPVEETNLYELKDHLGSIRAVIGQSGTVGYLATMEDYRDSLEAPYFELNKVVTVAHT